MAMTLHYKPICKHCYLAIYIRNTFVAYKNSNKLFVYIVNYFPLEKTSEYQQSQACVNIAVCWQDLFNCATIRPLTFGKQSFRQKKKLFTIHSRIMINPCYELVNS